MIEFGVGNNELLAVQRSLLLAGPTLMAAILVLVCKPKSREAVGVMVSFLWQLPSLLLLNLLAFHFQWWWFEGQRNMLVGLPIDVWIGWAIWWGPVAVLLRRWLSLTTIITLTVIIDLLSMPNLTSLVHVGPYWLVGEMAALALCLLPGLWIANLTAEGRNPKRRAMFHVLGWGGYMVLVIPICALTFTGLPLERLYRLPVNLADYALVATGALLLFIGIMATAEFARVGRGTPIPFDPPGRVVTSGPYAFTANPMQIISAFFMSVLALYAWSGALAFIAAMFLAFDTIFAASYNRDHIARAMPDAWNAYRSAVKEWKFRWSPHVENDAEIVISSSGPAHFVWQRLWPFLSRHLQGNLKVVQLSPPQFKRLVYRRHADGIEEYGVSAASRILEHGPAPIAMLAWTLRFPYIGGAMQRMSAMCIVAWRYWAKVPR